MFYSLENTCEVSLQRTPPLSPICLSFEGEHKICIYLCLHLGNAEKIFSLYKHTIEISRLYYNTFKVVSAENTCKTFLV